MRPKRLAIMPSMTALKNVRIGTGGEQRGAAGVCRHIGGDSGDAGAGRRPDLRRGLFQRTGAAGIQDQFDALAGQSHGTTFPQPLAGAADDGLAARNSHIHAPPRFRIDVLQQDGRRLAAAQPPSGPMPSWVRYGSEQAPRP
jgi:hypothetical protein